MHLFQLGTWANVLHVLTYILMAQWLFLCIDRKMIDCGIACMQYLSWYSDSWLMRHGKSCLVWNAPCVLPSHQNKWRSLKQSLGQAQCYPKTGINQAKCYPKTGFNQIANCLSVYKLFLPSLIQRNMTPVPCCAWLHRANWTLSRSEKLDQLNYYCWSSHDQIWFFQLHL